MKTPDVTSPKVLYPAISFLIVKLFVHTDDVSEALTFGLIYYTMLRLFTNHNITKKDILLPSITLFILFPSSDGDGSIAYHTALFMLMNAFSRAIFPN
jgi:hypothetical protein